MNLAEDKDWSVSKADSDQDNVAKIQFTTEEIEEVTETEGSTLDGGLPYQVKIKLVNWKLLQSMTQAFQMKMT